MVRVVASVSFDREIYNWISGKADKRQLSPYINTILRTEMEKEEDPTFLQRQLEETRKRIIELNQRENEIIEEILKSTDLDQQRGEARKQLVKELEENHIAKEKKLIEMVEKKEKLAGQIMADVNRNPKLFLNDVWISRQTDKLREAGLRVGTCQVLDYIRAKLQRQKKS